MTTADVVPAFLAVCPAIAPAWRENLAFWGDETNRGYYNDAGVIAQHLVDSFGRGDLSEFPAVFAVLERCFAEGDADAQNLAAVGVVEGIQNVASHRPFGPDVFLAWLGLASRAAWDELCVFWDQVAEAKAVGLLGLPPGQPPTPVVDPADVQDPALRKIVEQVYRK